MAKERKKQRETRKEEPVAVQMRVKRSFCEKRTTRDMLQSLILAHRNP
jgi:hypothetical protein